MEELEAGSWKVIRIQDVEYFECFLGSQISSIDIMSEECIETTLICEECLPENSFGAWAGRVNSPGREPWV